MSNRTVPGGSAHTVQLFDSESTRIVSVASFVRTSLADGQTVLIVATLEHWKAVAATLWDVDLVRAHQSGHLIIRDAGRTLQSFMQRGTPDRDRFEGSIGALVAELLTRGRPLSVYGEMVDVLAIQGEFEAALALERLWDELSTRHVFTLLCGYSAVSFGDPRSAAALRSICEAHTHVCSARDDDPLGTFLLNAYGVHPG